MSSFFTGYPLGKRKHGLETIIPARHRTSRRTPYRVRDCRG